MKSDLAQTLENQGSHFSTSKNHSKNGLKKVLFSDHGLLNESLIYIDPIFRFPTSGK